MGLDFINFLLGVAVLAIVPLLMAAYGGHVAAETIQEKSHQRNVKRKFWSIAVLGIVLSIAYQYRMMKSDEDRQTNIGKWQNGINDKLKKLIDRPASEEQRQGALQLKREVSHPSGENAKTHVPEAPKPIDRKPERSSANLGEAHIRWLHEEIDGSAYSNIYRYREKVTIQTDKALNGFSFAVGCECFIVDKTPNGLFTPTLNMGAGALSVTIMVAENHKSVSFSIRSPSFLPDNPIIAYFHSTTPINKVEVIPLSGN